MEQRVIDTLRSVFELNGFVGIETRAIEPGSSLLKKGETSKEIYLLSRLQEVGHESETPVERRLGLHFDGITPADGGELIARFNGLCEIHHIDMGGEDYAMAKEGLDTLTMIVDEAAHIRPGSVIADLKIARGLDYYTGSVYETFLDGADSLGSICSGGRYDNLASQGNRTYPGVGRSFGLSRLVSYMLHSAGEENRGDSNAIARALRARGIAADVAPTAAKLGKQIKYADKLGIPYVWFPNEDSTNDGPDEVKNIVTGEQVGADAQSWEPDTVYAQQTVAVAGSARS